MKENIFGQFLREKRLSLGISLKAMAFDLGISSSYLSDIERGVRGPIRRLFEKHAESLRVDLDVLEAIAAQSRMSFKIESTTAKHREVGYLLMCRWTYLSFETLSEIERVVKNARDNDDV